MHEKWSPQAEQDLRYNLKIILTIWDEKLADQFLKIVRTCTDRIKAHPTQNPFFSPRRGIRKYIIDGHNAMYYQIEADTIEILRIFPTRSNPAKLGL